MKKSREERITDAVNGMVAHGWIFNDLELEGNEALVYAALYATRKMKLQKTEAALIYGHLRIVASTFYGIRDDLCKKGLLELTGDGKETYYDVKDPLLATSEKANKIAERYEQNSAARTRTSDTEISEENPPEISSPAVKSQPPSQLGFFGDPRQAVASTGDAEKENPPAPAVDKNTASDIDSVSDSSEKPMACEETTAEKPSSSETAPQPVKPPVSEPGHMTKKDFCDKWQVESDGTENTEGFDWDKLDFEYERSRYLRENPRAKILAVICRNYDPICKGHWSDEAMAKRKAEREKAQGQIASVNSSEQ